MVASNFMQIRVFALLTALLILGFVRGEENSEEEDSRCNFFCTLQPRPQEPINVDIYRNLSCTHLIYGPAEIGSNLEIKTPSTYDLTEPSTIGNYDKLRYWRYFKNPIRKLYLGIYSDRKMHMLSNTWTQGVFTKNLLEHLRLYHFDGFVLFTDGTETWSRDMKNFLLHFREQQKVNNQTVEIFLSLPARLIGTARSYLRDLEPLMDGLYLITDDSSATENPNLAVSVDPLHPNPPQVPDVDTITENTGQLVYNGFPEEKIIVGLSSWARGYILPEGVTQVSHGSKIAGITKGGATTNRNDGKLAYREICKWLTDSTPIYDNKTETVSIVHGKIWFSVVLPDHQSFKNKIKWIAAQNFMGIGLSSLVSDDHTNVCGKGEWPLHKTISDEFKCKNRRKKRNLMGSCTRMCSYQPREGEKFDYKDFESHWCSHMIILSADLLSAGGVKVGTTVANNIKAFDAWDVKAKPLLILSIGGNQEKETWRTAIGNANRRTVVKEYDLDGVDISWTLSSPENVWDAGYLAQFLAELRLSIPNKKLILSVTPQFSYNYHIKPEIIGQSVDYFLLQGYKFHAANHLFTGHHSPLFISSELLADPKMTIEGLSYDWVSRGVAASKLIVGFSAEGMSMYFQNVRSDNEIGAPANTFRNYHRAGNGGSVSQSEICRMLQDNQTKSVFIEELGIPYATRNDEFIAYDNARSMQVKAIWASLNNFGGIGLYAIEMDNIYGECPAGRPFTLLKTLIKSQVCDYCIRENQTKKPKENSKSVCEPNFQVACSYRLPKGDKSLNPEKIPFEQCTEIVIEEAGLTAAGKIGFSEENSDESLKELSKVNSENGTKPLIASIQCQMKDTEFTDLMKNPSTAVSEIDAMVKKYQLQGVEIKCDSLITNQNKDLYTKFLEELKTTLNKGNGKQCPITISVRIPVYNLRLNETYDIELLNSLHHVSLESFQTSLTESQLVSPLFSVPNDDQTAIDTTITHWLDQGLKREVLLMHIPAYGIIQQLSQDIRKQHEVGETVKENFIQIVTQKDICTKLDDNAGVQNKLIYDYVAAYAITPTNEWISYESQATITYKMKYAIREGLAGIGLMSLNDDDDESVCKQGAFPLLHAINRNVCPST
uniref:GH18 domain-containing protein n=1 Tax=Panagrolaimus superbus TaxID=310955 RepID=A0A914YE10_9BILA